MNIENIVDRKEISRYIESSFNSQEDIPWVQADDNESIRTWEAPNSGVIRIMGNVSKAVGSVKVGKNFIRIKRNETTIWPSCQDKGYISEDNTIGFFHDIYTGVSKEDRICFIVSNNGGQDITWNPMIQYVEDSISSTNLILPNDVNIKYVGRWDKDNSSLYNSYWGGAYFITRFTGTSVKLRLAAPFNIYVNIDNQGDKLLAGLYGDVNLTFDPLASGIHTLKVSAAFQDDEIKLQGILLDQGASLQTTEAKSNIIEFIGDSITTGGSTMYGDKSSYAWLAAEQLYCEHTQISTSGIPLVSGFGYCDGKGMMDWYFKQKAPGHPSSPGWDFNMYTSSMVVINLGTNDSNDYENETDFMFQSCYEAFIMNIKEKYPNAEIFAMRPFGGFREEPIKDAVKSLVNQGYSKLHYINTTGWMNPEVDTTDGIHPHDNAGVKLAGLLANQLCPYL